jgi:4-amino-4-deoxy-L-arabinose transferase-like glycosyltransferase
MLKQVNRSYLFIALILLIGVSLRIWGLNYDLPYIYHPDEPLSLSIIQPLFKTGDLNPHFFQYPSLFYYINAIAYVPYYLIGKLLGIFTSRNDILAPISLIMGVVRAPMPSIVLLGRTITVIFGVGSVVLIYIIGKQLTGKAIVGMLAALMLAVAIPNVSLSRYITPDTFVVFFATASFLASVLIYKQGKTRYYVIAGICVGLTASTKYNGGLIVLPMILAHFLRYGKLALNNRNLYIALLMCVCGFLIGTPFALLDFPKFWADMKFQAIHYSTGHAGMEGDTLKWYLSYMWRTGGILYVLSILGILQGIYSRSKELILLSSFAVVYFVFINSLVVRNDRTFLPLTPFLFLLAASFLEFLFRKSSTLISNKWRNISKLVLYGLVLITLIFPLSISINRTILVTSTDSRETSRVWIENNLPAGAKIALESYSPYVEPSEFSVQGVVRIIDHDPDWYIQNGYEYLVFSQGMYGRFYDEPNKYGAEISQYNGFFNRFELVKMFNDGNYDIRIYKVPLTLNP